MSADQTFIDRLTEILAVLCVAAALFILVCSGKISPGEGSLASLKVQSVSDQDMGRFQSLLSQARRLADSNRDPAPFLAELKESFPGRHEVWAVAGRYFEYRGEEKDAVFAYARAVRLQPDYLDERSGLFLGKRIEALTGKIMGELFAVRSSRELDSGEKQLLKTAYFLKRRLAGGCE
jgi:hypothetical protein